MVPRSVRVRVVVTDVETKDVEAYSIVSLLQMKFC